MGKTMFLKWCLLLFSFFAFNQSLLAIDLNKTIFQQNFTGTHNSFASKAYGWGIRNHRKSVYEQLKMGARGLMLDIHLDKGEVKFCHVTCRLTRSLMRIGRPLPGVQGILEEIKRFLSENPKEIVILRLEDYVKNKKFQEALFKAGLKNLLLKRSDSNLLTKPIREMVSLGKRLIVFSDSRSWEYILSTWNWFSENHWKPRKNKKCKLIRGGALRGQKILSINAFKKRKRSKLIQECHKINKRQTSFVWVDFI
jgi:hypothetical protein